MDKHVLISELSRIISRSTSGDDVTIARSYIEQVERGEHKLTNLLEFLNRSQINLV